MSIELVGITSLDNNAYRLDFLDRGVNVSFVLQVRRKKIVVVSSEFDRHFCGRSSATEAFDALYDFIRGEAVVFPIKVREDGYTGMGA